MFAPALATISLFSGVGLCKLYENVADLPNLHYDFVIVGGGAGGNTVANRLTEDPKVSVLVLEAGPSNAGVLDAQIPFKSNDFANAAGPYSWNYTTTPQAGAAGHVFNYLEGHLLGGSSSHNGMAYTRGAAADFDRYAQLTGDDGWSWNKILPYFLKNEKWSAPADNHDTTGQFNPAVHGTKGPISVSISGYSYSDFEQRVIQTTKELPDDFPFNLDMNSGKPLGIGWLQYTIGNGERSSSATGYLKPQVIQRPNLDVLLHAQVSKLVDFAHTGSPASPGTPAFGGVEFRHGSSLFVARASKELILSAGTIGTPRILLNSGVGDRKALQALGIQTMVDLPSVGKNASDHPYTGLKWAVNSNQTADSLFQNATVFNEALAQWNQSRTGPLVDSTPGTHAAWLRLSPDSPAFAVHGDPSPSADAPHFEVLFQPSGLGAPGNSISLAMAMISPVSRGSVSLSSNDPFAPPLIDPGLFANEFDALALAEGTALLFKFLSAPAWNHDGYLGAPAVDLTAMTPAERVDFVRSHAGPGYHIVGTAGMSPKGAQYGVVDPDLRVKGIAGLRVIDASVLPIVPAGHTQAATYVVAERGADMIKQTWK
ncbi:pyranose dehydrogenase [Mycena albidolilacea]|uniref:Pyranose dehydrogenase n=1 Tax=Mycena albidolilacea TaxID=1033008 RepID=A0AAD6ZIF2_9AGAR|nr:pyranose dehydrogenase [Mycena albidolilacea]